MAELDIELAAYRAQLFDLENQHRDKWVVFHDAKCAGIFESFEAAAVDAVKRFGRGPYLIRQVGAPPVALPLCLVQRNSDESSSVRV